MNIFERARQPGHDRRARTLVHALRLRKRLGTWLKGRLRECCDLEHSPPEGAAKPQRGMFSRVDAFVRDVRELETEDALAGALGDVSRDLGFRYFALTHHVDVRRSSAAIRIHNYPDGWAEWFDEQPLGATDPVHRASNITSVGFAWSGVFGLGSASSLSSLRRTDRWSSC
jgi:hypothetical protein